LNQAYMLLYPAPHSSAPVLSSDKGSTRENDATITSKYASSTPLSHTKLADLPGLSSQDIGQIEFKAGYLLTPRYEIKELIGQGGMGAVYRAFDKNRDEDIAIKVLLPSLTKNARALERFMTEARISSKLSHPKIVNVFDVQNDGAMYFLTMELLHGQDLRHLMETKVALGQEFTVDEVQELLKELCDALGYAHQQTVHRDIKPENIWITEEGEYKLMDFGIAQLQSTSQRTQTGVAMGTAYYMAPEQIKGSKNIDGRADLYSLGVLAYELLTGEVPAGMIEPLSEARKDVPTSLVEVVHSCLQAKAENRFDDCAALALALTAKKTKKPKTKPANTGAGAGAGANKWVVAVVALLVILGIGGMASSGLLDGLKPIDREALARQKNVAIHLLGEIKSMQKRLDKSMRELERNLEKAKRNRSPDRARLQEQFRLSEKLIADSNSRINMEGNLEEGKSQMQDDRKMGQAVVALASVKDQMTEYKNLFNDIETLLDKEQKVFQAKNDWAEYKRKYSLSDPAHIQTAESSTSKAARQKQSGEIATALATAMQAIDAYREAKNSVSSIVKSKEKRWEAAEKTKKERLENERKRKEKAGKAKREQLANEHRRKQEAESRRRAAVAAELKRQDDVAARKASLQNERMAAYEDVEQNLRVMTDTVKKSGEGYGKVRSWRFTFDLSNSGSMVEGNPCMMNFSSSFDYQYRRKVVFIGGSTGNESSYEKGGYKTREPVDFSNTNVEVSYGQTSISVSLGGLQSSSVQTKKKWQGFYDDSSDSYNRRSSRFYFYSKEAMTNGKNYLLFDSAAKQLSEALYALQTSCRKSV